MATPSLAVRAAAEPLTLDANKKLQAAGDKTDITSHVRGIFAKTLKEDPFNNTTFDFTTENALTTASIDVIKMALREVEDAVRSKKKHCITIKITQSQANLFQPILETGYDIHHAVSRQYVLFKKCLSNHTELECVYPKYRTASVGVTIVVFTPTLEKVLLVVENWGPAKGKLKPPTETVEYGEGLNETPTQAVLRGLKEETQLSAKKATFVAAYWGNNFRGSTPDLNFAYALKMQEAEIKVQSSELSKGEWISTKDYLAVKEEKPWIMRDIVRAAHSALNGNKEWNAGISFYTSGEPIELYSAL